MRIKIVIILFIGSIFAITTFPLKANEIYFWEREDEPTEFCEFIKSRYWLANVSSWVGYIDNPTMVADWGHQGAFAIGNGKVFSLIGIGYPSNTLHEFVGPSYGAERYGDTAVVLMVNNQILKVEKEWLFKVRNAAICIYKGITEDLDYYTIEFAPPGIPAIIRIIIVRNNSSDKIIRVKPIINMVGKMTVIDNNLYQERRDRNKAFLCAAPGEAEIVKDQLHFFTIPVPPGEEVIRSAFIITAKSIEEKEDIYSLILGYGAETLLEITRDHWYEWHRKLAFLESPDPKVNDLLQDQMDCIKTQQSEFGSLAVMSSYTIYNIRDDLDPIHLLCRLGDYQTVWESLNYHYKACWIDNMMSNSLGCDKDINNLPPEEPDWWNCVYMDNRNPAEAPSFIPLKYFEYYKHTNDLDFLNQHYEFVKAWLLREEWEPNWIQKISGDECWRWVFGMATGLFEPERFMWSSYGSFLFVPAAKGLAEIAKALGYIEDAALILERANFVEQACENLFWLSDIKCYSPGILFFNNQPLKFPFEDINTAPYWSGYCHRYHQHGKENLITTMNYLLREDGTIQSKMMVPENYTGMQPGNFLLGLTMYDHPLAEKTFNAMNLITGATGETAEGQYHSDHSVVVLVHKRDGSRGDITARYRPWEGGSTVNSIMTYLTGLKTDLQANTITLAPHIPNNWGYFAMKNNRLGEIRYNFYVSDDGKSQTIRVANSGNRSFDLNLIVSVEGDQFTSLLVNEEFRNPSDYPIESEWGRTRILLYELSVLANSNLTISVEYKKISTPTPTPSPTCTPSPHPTATPTNTPSISAKILLGGYVDSRLIAGTSGWFNFLALTNHYTNSTLEIYFQGNPTGIYLYDDGNHNDLSAEDGLYANQFLLTPQDSVYILLELALTLPNQPICKWPYLKIND